MPASDLQEMLGCTRWGMVSRPCPQSDRRSPVQVGETLRSTGSGGVRNPAANKDALGHGLPTMPRSDRRFPVQVGETLRSEATAALLA